MDTTTRMHDLGDRVAGTVDELRGTAAAAIGDDRAAFRELGRVRRGLDNVEARLGELLTSVDDRLAAVETDVDGLVDRLDRGKRTTWPRRLFWLAVGVAAGAAAAGLLDPDTGASRRASLAERARSTTRDVVDEARSRADHAAGIAKGAVIEGAKEAFHVEQSPVDLDTLRQKIKSEVIGPMDATGSVEVDLEPGGKVTVTGTVGDASTRADLVAGIRRVDGVRDVIDALEAG